MAAKQLFFTYLSNIDSIDVIEGEETLTAFEQLTIFFDQYLCQMLQVEDWVQKAEQAFQNRILKKVVATAKLKQEIAKAKA